MGLDNWQRPGTVDNAVYGAVQAAMQAEGGHVGVAAQRLGVGRTTLYRYLDQFRLNHLRRPTRHPARK